MVSTPFKCFPPLSMLFGLFPILCIYRTILYGLLPISNVQYPRVIFPVHGIIFVRFFPFLKELYHCNLKKKIIYETALVKVQFITCSHQKADQVITFLGGTKLSRLLILTECSTKKCYKIVTVIKSSEIS